MKTLRYLFFTVSICCVLVFYMAACHLDSKKDDSPKAPAKPISPITTSTTKLELYIGSVDFTNTKKYRQLLREHRRCDPCSHYIGPADCKNFDSKADVTIQFEKNELPSPATLKIKLYYSNNNLPIYGYFGACATTLLDPSVPFVFKGTAKYWNDYKGFHVLFGAEDGGGLSSLIIRSYDSIPGSDGTLSVSLYYGGLANDNYMFGTADLESPDADSFGGYGGRGGR